MKESLISGRIKTSSCHKSRQVGPIDLRSKQGRPLSYANVVRRCVGGYERSILMGWRCRPCGSWDVYAAALSDLEENGLATYHTQNVNFGS